MLRTQQRRRSLATFLRPKRRRSYQPATAGSTQYLGLRDRPWICYSYNLIFAGPAEASKRGSCIVVGPGLSKGRRSAVAVRRRFQGAGENGPRRRRRGRRVGGRPQGQDAAAGGADHLRPPAQQARRRASPDARDRWRRQVRRRTFITLLGGAAAWPLAAHAQLPMPKVGYVWIGEPGTDVSGAGLRQGLADRGYVIGRNLVLEERYAYGVSEKVPAFIAELLALKVDVLVTVGTFASLAARRAT